MLKACGNLGDSPAPTVESDDAPPDEGRVRSARLWDQAELMYVLRRSKIGVDDAWKIVDAATFFMQDRTGDEPRPIRMGALVAWITAPDPAKALRIGALDLDDDLKMEAWKALDTWRRSQCWPSEIEYPDGLNSRFLSMEFHGLVGIDPKPRKRKKAASQPQAEDAA